MDRKIKSADIQTAIDEAYEKYKDSDEGKIDELVSATSDTFGISIVLTDGRIFEKGDTKAVSPMDASHWYHRMYLY